MRTMKRTLSQGGLAALMLLVCVSVAYADLPISSPYADTDYVHGSGRKLGRGLANVLFGWVDIFKGVQEVDQENGLIAASTYGPIYGIGKALERSAAGVYEIVTFPIPVSGNFEPIIEPEFVADS